MSVSLKRYQDVSQQMMAIMEKRHVFSKGLEVAWGELSELKEHFTRYKENHKEPTEKLKKVHILLQQGTTIEREK